MAKVFKGDGQGYCHAQSGVAVTLRGNLELVFVFNSLDIQQLSLRALISMHSGAAFAVKKCHLWHYGDLAIPSVFFTRESN